MKKSSNQSGFTLIEMAVVVLIIGLLMGGAIMLMKPYIAMVKRNSTQAKMENIAQALALYAQNYGRLPCPGDPNLAANGTPPYGSPRNSGTDGNTIGSNGCGGNNLLYRGIVPFRALGLSEKDILDAWKNPISYTVSAGLTKFDPNDLSAAPPVHEQCRTQLWQGPAGNLNVKKAEICCPDSATGSSKDIIGLHAKSVSGGTFVSSQLIVARNPLNGPTAEYQAPNIAVIGTPASTSNTLIAFALVSHGENGEWAYVPHTANRIPDLPPANNRELFNATNAYVMTSATSTSLEDNGLQYFDDIVLWRTNDQLISAFGNDSCARP